MQWLDVILGMKNLWCHAKSLGHSTRIPAFTADEFSDYSIVRNTPDWIDSANGTENLYSNSSNVI